MRKQFLPIALIALMGFGANAQTVNLPIDKLPKGVTDYVKTNFPNQKIESATSEKEGLSLDYNVLLNDKTKLEFDKLGKLKEVESTSKLPDSVVPKSISDYVKAKYPNNYIKSWEKDGKNQQVELDNGTDLEFDALGKFIKIDQ